MWGCGFQLQAACLHVLQMVLHDQTVALMMISAAAPFACKSACPLEPRNVQYHISVSADQEDV